MTLAHAILPTGPLMIVDGFAAPGFLFLGLLALLLWVGPLAARDARHGALRTAAFLLAVLALAQPHRLAADDGAHRVVALDRSASVAPGARDAAVAAVAGLPAPGGQDRLTVVDLAPPGAAPVDAPEGARVVRVPAEGRSDLGALLDAVAREVPAGAARAGALLITDGLGTDDARGSDSLLARADLAARGVPVDLALVEPLEGDLRAVGLDLRGAARVGREVVAVARVEGGGQVVTVTLADEEGELARADGVVADGEVRVPLVLAPRAAGFVDVRLTVEVTDGADPRGGDLVLERTIAVDDPMRVAYLGERVEGGAERLGALLGDGFEVVPCEPGDLAPGAAAHGAAVVVVDDRPAASLDEGVQQGLVAAVEAGARGLVMAGGEASFGPGGYHDLPLEAALPVEFVQKEEKRDPSTTLVVIIDTSGSMGGNRVQLAKEVSRLAIRRLLPHDKVGLVEFYGAKRWAVPIQPASNSIEIERALNRLDAGGGTVILPAIEEAYYGLKNVRTRYKHVLILTDGGVESGAFEPLVRRMADEGMTVSTVLVGPEAHSEFLFNIANWGRGRFYNVPNRFNLPEILLKQPATAKLPAYRPGVVQIRAQGGESWWGEIEREELPPLSGYVETRRRPGAEVLVETADEGHPVLATWRYGAGRVSALTTEPTGPGTEGWRDWSGQGELLARVVERTAAEDPSGFRLRAVREPGGALVVLQSTRPSPSSAPGVRVGRGPDAAELALVRVAPDRWQAHVEWDGRTPLCVEARAGGAPAARAVLPAHVGAASELQVPASAARALADRLGPLGARVDLASLPEEGVRVAALDGAAAPRVRHLAPLLALLALLAYVADIALRRSPAARLQQ